MIAVENNDTMRSGFATEHKKAQKYHLNHREFALRSLRPPGLQDFTTPSLPATRAPGPAALHKQPFYRQGSRPAAIFRLG